MNSPRDIKVVVIGYPYTRPNYRAVFESTNIFFILPRIWKIKKGKAEYRTENSQHIMTTLAPFDHSDYPIIRGLLKGWMPAFPWLLWQLKRKHGVELVFEAHEPTLISTLYHGIVAKTLGLKHVVFSWENIPFKKKFYGIKGFFHWLILSANLALADGVVCGNQKCLDIFKNITDKPLAHIPLAGLDPERFRPFGPRPKRDYVTFLFAGAIDYRKGLHVLLPAFKRLLAQIPNARLIIVGSGTYEEHIDHQISKLDLQITKLPWADHSKLIDVMSQSDVFLYPSISYAGWAEQFGYSMAEASLMEMPVIATQSGSIEEVVVHGVTGLLVPESDESNLFKAMILLAGDDKQREDMGHAGRNFIIENYANSVISRKYSDFFKLISSR
jgi:glycosyltransferase involved in cell wall biosynthesis